MYMPHFCHFSRFIQHKNFFAIFFKQKIKKYVLSSKHHRVLSLLLTALYFSICDGCVTNSSIKHGLQPEFSALNFGRIIAVPIFMEPDPGRRTTVDIGSIETNSIVPIIEESLLKAFKDQPGVAGVGFNTVRKALGNPPEIWERLNTEIRSKANLFSVDDPILRNRLSDTCRKQSNFVEFYYYCIMKSGEWISSLNELSAKVLNADAALISVITELNKGANGSNYYITAEVTVLLVDTNNGKLIWSKQQKETLESTKEKTFPEWISLFSRMFSEPFWLDFPGRVQKI